MLFGGTDFFAVFIPGAQCPAHEFSMNVHENNEFMKQHETGVVYSSLSSL